MQKRLYNLDGLRFLAAWVVLICHLEVLKSWFGIENFSWRFYANTAQIAVTFFFVLSGFLISYLLLKEKKKNASDKINIGRFYLKRIRRIWPLYYLLLLICFFAIRNQHFFYEFPSMQFKDDGPLNSRRFLGYLFFLPNTSELFHGGQMYLSQTWSLGVEEFFYLFFPLALYFIKWKKLPYFLAFVVFVFFALSISLPLISQSSKGANASIDLAAIYIDRYRIYGFALGGLAAWFLLLEDRKESWLVRLFRKRSVSGIVMLILFILVSAGITASVATQQLYSIFFAILLFSITISGARYRFLNHPVMIYLGKISYGIYMLHPIALIVILRWMSGIKDGILLQILLPLGATMLTIAMAAVSYELYEKYFLKKRFTE